MAKRLPESLKTIVIAGASGLVAKSLKYGFESIGCRVVTISNKKNVENTISWNQLKLDGLPSEASSVINACGKNIFTPIPFSRLKDEIYESRVGTNLMFRDAIIKANKKPKSFITMSGVGLYKIDPSIVHDEDSTQFNDGFWTDLIKKWEGATELPSTIQTRRVMIRSGVVLSRHGGMLQNMLPQFKFGFGGTIGSGNQYMPFIHIKDLIKLIVFCAEISSIQGPVNAVAPNYCTMKDFTETLAKGLKRPHLFGTPEVLIKRMVCKERAEILLGSVKVRPKKALDNGFEFQFPDIYSAIRGGITGELMY